MRRLLISKQGLLDTGANISCIGADLAARDWSSFKQFRKISSHVRTADGGSQAVTGTLNVEVAYNNAKHPVTFFVIPTIEKRVILGIDFWKTFRLVPGLISAIDPPISTVESPPDNEESFPLTQIQKKRLDGTMCQLVDELIPADLKHCVFGYLDDVCVVSEDFDTHLSVLLRLSEQFRKANLTLNIAKSRFCVTEVQYLGFVIGRGGIATDPSKVDAIRSWPSPKTLKQARRFLGLVGWYRRFIQNFAEVVFPITELLSTKKKFVWTDTAQEAFDKLKDLLPTAPILQNPDFSKPFFVHCDASDFGVGAVLIQLTDEGIEKPVAFMSKKLNTAQRNYSVTERECLSAVLTIEKFRCYLELQEFELITDHASLLWLMRQPNLRGRLARWAMRLQGYKFSDQIFFAYGVPQTIVSDNGPQFKAVEFNAWLTSRGIRHIYTAVYSPQSNASERVNRSLVAGIRAFLEGNHSEWDAHIHAISCALRNATHQSIGCSPYHALYGFDMMTHGTQYELLHKLGMLNESENVLHRDDLLKLLLKIAANKQTGARKPIFIGKILTLIGSAKVQKQRNDVDVRVSRRLC
ncbi:hypothetical protein ACLKA7_014661 [Drosophila subpalustris]